MDYTFQSAPYCTRENATFINIMKLNEFQTFVDAKGVTLTIAQARAVPVGAVVVGVSVSLDMSNPLSPKTTTKQATFKMFADGLHHIAEPKKSDDPFHGKNVIMGSYPTNETAYLNLTETIEVVRACLIHAFKFGKLPSSVGIKRKNMGFVRPEGDVDEIKRIGKGFENLDPFISCNDSDNKTPKGYLKINGLYVIRYPDELLKIIHVKATSSDQPIDLGLAE